MTAGNSRAGLTIAEFAKTLPVFVQIARGEYVFRDRNRLRKLYPMVRSTHSR